MTAKLNQCAARSLDYRAINSTALAQLPSLLARWLPEGKVVGAEYKALNPTRVDQRIGSFSVNLHTGRWADFATGDKGGDVISLTAYLFRLRQSAAAQELARMLGVQS